MTRAKKPSVRATKIHQQVDTGEFFVKLGFRCINGNKGRLLAPRSQVSDPRGVQRDLAKLGVELTPTLLDDIKAALSDSTVPIVQSTRTCGWHKDAYALPHAIFGKRGSLTALRRDLRDECMAGTANGWREGLAPVCAASSFITFAIAAAFAGPLLRRLRYDEGVIFHLYGQTTTGKSTALMAAQSVYEGADRNRLRTFDLTPRALEEEAAACNDGLLVLDEAGRINGEVSKAKYFGALAFLGAGGQGRQRSKKAVEDANLQNVRFLLVGLSNGEEPLDDPRTPRRGGEQVRLISVPVPAPEKGGVFDLERDGETRRELADEAGAVCGAHHGMAIKRFVWTFVHDPESAGRGMDYVDKFLHWAVPHPHPFAERFARKFAVVFAAAMLADDFGIAPWSRKEGTKAIRKVFRVAWEEVRPPEVEAEDLIQRLAKEAENEDRFPVVERGEELPADTVGKAWGIRRTAGGQMDLALFRGTFSDLVTGAEDKVLHALERKGVLLPGKEPRLFVRQLRILGLKAERTHVLLFDAAKLKALAAPGRNQAAKKAAPNL